MGLDDIDDRLRMAERLNKAIRENTDIEEVHVGWDNRAEIVEEFRTSYGELFTQKDSNPEKL